MKAVKSNKEYSVDESQKKFYQDRGFDIKDDKGEVIAYGRGKTVPYDEYEKTVKQNKELKEQINKLQAKTKVSATKTKSPEKKKENNDSSNNSDNTPENKKG